MKKTVFLLCIGLLSLTIHSCKDDPKPAHLSVNMTDAPGNYDAVLIDLQSVEVTGNSAVMINAIPGIYNLLDFTNGLDTLIATGDLEEGTLSQIRLILGPNNQVMIDSVLYPLETPSAQQSGLKVQVHQTMEAGVSYAILLDFDANESIVEQGNGTYSLKPVIRTIDAAISGSIKGSVTPIGTLAAISTSLNGVNYSTTASPTGEFLLAGLPAGTYDVTITPPAPLLPVTLTGKVVVVGASTDLGVVPL